MGDKFNGFAQSGVKLVEISGDKSDLPQQILAAASEPSRSDPVLDHRLVLK